MTQETQTTLRDTLSEAFDAQPEKQVEVEPKVESQPLQTTPTEQRDDKGRFAGKEPVPQVTDKPARPGYPSTWKKGYEKNWETSDPQWVDYLLQRENEYKKGVSTYKNEAEKAKEIWDAISAHQDYINIRGGNPTEVIRNLLQTAAQFNKSDPNARLEALIQIARQFNIPIEQAFGQQGQGNPNQYIINKLQNIESQWNNFQTSQQKSEINSLTREIQSFAEDSNHPHFEQVKETMAGLLQAGVADDLKSAYEAAVRMPKHSDIFDAMQKEKSEADERKRLENSQRQAKAAREKNVSLRSSTPAGTGTTSSQKGLRDVIEKSFDDINSRV